jgi:hypothetical protein
VFTLTPNSRIYYRAGIPFSRGFPLATLQVGLRNSAGDIVLGGDQLMIEEVGEIRTARFVRKIFISKDCKFAVAFAGNKLAQNVAQELVDMSLPISDLRQAVIDSVRRLGRKEKGDVVKCSLVVIWQGSLWDFKFDRKGLDRDWLALNEPPADLARVVIGDHSNPAAQHFLNRCYGTHTVVDLDVSALKRLAAQIVVASSNLNPNVIRGLDMIVWSRQTQEIVREDTTQLKAWAESLDSALDRAIRNGGFVSLSSDPTPSS